MTSMFVVARAQECSHASEPDNQMKFTHLPTQYLLQIPHRFLPIPKCAQ